MARTIVGILRGGPSSEYEYSLKTGAALLNALPEENYDTRDIFIDKTGLWHSRGMPADPSRALAQIDVVLNAVHGGPGEDGTIQRILDLAGVPYAGSSALASNSALNKILTREILYNAGIRMPSGVAFSTRDGTTADMARVAFSIFGPPYVVKPPSEGSSRGIYIVDTIMQLPDAIGDVLDAYGTALVEQFMYGDEATVGVIQDFRNEELYALPPAHVVIPDDSRYLDHQTYRDGNHRHDVPSNFSHEEKRAIADMAKAAHRALGLSHFSNADMILTKRGPYLLEVNTVPGLHDKAPFPHMLESVGSSVSEFAQHMVNLARKS